MKKLLALLPFLALMVFVTSCSDDDDDSPVTPTPTPVEKVLELKTVDGVRADSIIAELQISDNGATESVIIPEILNKGNADVKIQLEIKIDSNTNDDVLVVAACLGNGSGGAQCLPGFSKTGMHVYDKKDIEIQPNVITDDTYISIHFQPAGQAGVVTGELIFTNKANKDDVITIPYYFKATKSGIGI